MTTLRPKGAEPPTLSVVMPSYNHAAYVEEAVAGVFASQDAPSFELVVVDDGSTDESVEILRRFDDPRLQLITQSNQGAHRALARGLNAARGEIVLLLNSDDVFDSRRLATIADVLQANPDVVAVATWLRLIGPAGDEIGIKRGFRNMPPWSSRRPDLHDLGDPQKALLQSNWISTTSNIAFHRGRLNGAVPTFRDLRYCHDWDFFLQLLAHGPLLEVTEPLVSYRVHPENTLKEGAGGGKAQMELEILWLLICHAATLWPKLGFDDADRARFWRSMPPFGRPAQIESLLHRLVALRGSDSVPRDAFFNLLRPEDALRRHFLSQLASPVPPESLPRRGL